VLLLQHYNKFGYNFSFLKTGNSALLFFAAMVVAAIIFYALAVLVNHKLYNTLGKIICQKWFSVLIAICSLTIFYFIDRHSLGFIAIHLLLFIPVSWLISKLEINMLALIIGLLLVKDIFFTFLQVIQIYF
jgi:hypothetical protein